MNCLPAFLMHTICQNISTVFQIFCDELRSLTILPLFVVFKYLSSLELVASMGCLKQYGYTAIYTCHFLPSSETRTLSMLNGSSLNHSGYLQCCDLTDYFHILDLPEQSIICLLFKSVLQLMQTVLYDIQTGATAICVQIMYYRISVTVGYTRFRNKIHRDKSLFKKKQCLRLSGLPHVTEFP